ncbi:50S ribosomal protein L29 [Candidatus Woesebacteria bacterium]|nr:50S ribosomal protein L29 [Candidatus Woesebacteria bacterium]QQG47789.1 MAG: 50S ribosomal protein L29 [Candidatus Woesebacteria bacterium]
MEKTLIELKKEYAKTLMDIYTGKEKNLKKGSLLRKEIARTLERYKKV